LADACAAEATDPFILELYRQEAGTNQWNSWVMLAYLLIILRDQAMPQRIDILRLLRNTIRNWAHQDGAQDPAQHGFVRRPEADRGGGDAPAPLLESPRGAFGDDEAPLMGDSDDVLELFPEDEADPEPSGDA
jgi:hypothetical protein